MRAHLVEQARKLGIKNIAKKNMEVLQAEILTLSKQKVVNPPLLAKKSQQKSPKLKNNLTYGPNATNKLMVGKPYVLSDDEYHTGVDDMYSMMERDIHYKGKKLDLEKVLNVTNILKKCEGVKMIEHGQFVTLWYDFKNDVFIVITDVAMKSGSGASVVFEVVLGAHGVTKANMMLIKKGDDNDNDIGESKEFKNLKRGRKMILLDTD